VSNVNWPAAQCVMTLPFIACSNYKLKTLLMGSTTSDAVIWNTPIYHMHTYSTLNVTHTLGQVRVLCPNPTPMHSLFPVGRTNKTCLIGGICDLAKNTWICLVTSAWMCVVTIGWMSFFSTCISSPVRPNSVKLDIPPLMIVVSNY